MSTEKKITIGKEIEHIEKLVKSTKKIRHHVYNTLDGMNFKYSQDKDELVRVMRLWELEINGKFNEIAESINQLISGYKWLRESFKNFAEDVRVIKKKLRL